MSGIARKGGTDTIVTNHGCDAITSTKEGSENVFVNGKGAVRSGDLCEVHTILVGNSCVPHQVPLTASSSSVFVNGKAVCRKNDGGSGHVITSASENVFAGG